jgi:hypothetical protein
MRLRRALALTAIATGAIVVFAMPASSSATALCEWETYSCPAMFPANTAIAAALETKTEASFTTGAGTVQCKESILKGETTQQEAEPLQGTIATLEITACTLSGKSCTVTTENRPYTTKLTYGEGNGTLAISGKEKSPTIKLKCGETLNCTLSGTPEVPFTSGSPAKIVFTKVKSFKSEGLCAETTFTATYVLSSPNSGTVYVSFRGPMPTKLCTAVPTEVMGELKCPGGSGYAGEVVKGELAVGVAYFRSTADATKEVTCNEASYTGKFKEDGGPITGVGISGLTYTQNVGGKPGKPCSSTFTGAPTVTITVENLPFSTSLIRYRGKFNPQGELDVRPSGGSTLGLKLVINNGGPDTCKYTVARMSGHWYNGVGANPSLLTDLGAGDWARIAGAGECPAGLTTSATVNVKSATNGNLYVSTP